MNDYIDNNNENNNELKTEEEPKKKSFWNARNICFIVGACVIVIGIVVMAVIVATQPNSLISII